MNRVNVISSIVMMSILLSLPQAFQSITADPGNPAVGVGTLYGTDSGLGSVVTIDPTTGIQTPLGNLLQNTDSGPGLAFDKINGVLYLTDGGGADTIYIVDLVIPMDGLANPIGGAANFANLGMGFAAMASLDFDSAGVLYGSANIVGNGGSGGDHLATIHLGTGLATIIGPYGVCQNFTPGAPFPADGSGDCDIEGIEAIGFDGSGQLWGIARAHNLPATAVNTVANGLYQINAVTGQAAIFTTIQNAPAGGMVSMEFACDGTIYVGSQRNSGGELGQVTIIGNVATYASIGGGTAFGNSLAGLAFDTACDGEPSAIGGDILSINTASLLVAGMQTGFAWILPLVLSAVGIGALVIRKITRD